MNEITYRLREPRRFGRSAVAGSTVLLTVAAAWLWAHEGHAPMPTKGVVVDAARGQIALSKEAREALDVRLAGVVSKALPEKLLAPAVVVSPWQKYAFANSRLPGRIVALLVKPGQEVEAGDVLAEVRSVDLEALQVELLNAKVESDLSRKLLEDLEGLTESVSGQQKLEARIKHRQNLNIMAIGKSKWLSLGLSRESLVVLLRDGAGSVPATLPVRSPIRGTVVHTDLSVGRFVEASEHLFEVVDLSTAWVKIGILEKDLRHVRAGQPVEIQLAAYPGKVFASTIAYKGTYLDPQTHLNFVWAKVENNGPGPALLPGMAGQAQVVLPGSRAALAVPTDALIDDGLDRYVLVEEAHAAGKSEYRKRSVQVLRQTPDWAEILATDLLPGDRVVTQGSPQLGGLLVPGVLKLTPSMARNIGLRVEPLQVRVVDNVVTLAGAAEVPPARRGFASAQLAGTLDKVLVVPGQPVTAGQVVAEVISTEVQALELELLKEHLATQLWQEQLDKIQDLKTSMPRRTYLEVETSLTTSRNRRDSLRRRLAVLGLDGKQLERLVRDGELVQALPVRAPLSGFVCNFDKVLGQALKAEDAVVEIHDLTRLWVQAFVPEQDIGRVGVGQAARVRFVSDPESTYTGKVVRSGQVFAAGTRALSLWIELDHWPEGLQHNQLATIHLTASQPAPTLVVPPAALVREGTQAFVFVQRQDGSFERRPVTSGRTDDRWVEITAGLVAGEPVAVAGAAQLQTAYASIR